MSQPYHPPISHSYPTVSSHQLKVIPGSLGPIHSEKETRQLRQLDANIFQKPHNLYPWLPEDLSLSGRHWAPKAYKHSGPCIHGNRITRAGQQYHPSFIPKTAAMKQLFIHLTPFWRHCCASQCLVIKWGNQQGIWDLATSTGDKIEKNLFLRHLKVWLLLNDMKSMKDLYRFWESYQEKYCHCGLKGIGTFRHSKSWKKRKKKKKTTKLQDWEDDSASQMPSKQAWKPVFNPQKPHKSAWHDDMHWQS